MAPHSTTTAPHGTTPALAPRTVRAGPLCAPPVARTPSQPRVAVTESANSICDFFLAFRSVDGVLDFSMDPVFLLLLVLTLILIGIPVHTLFFLLLRGEMLPKRLLDRAQLPLCTLQLNEGAKIGKLPASLIPTRPESTDNTRQPTARSARRIARHAAIPAVQASPVLTTVAPASAALTTAAPASPVLIAPCVCGSVVAWPPGNAGDASACFCRSSPHERPSNLAPTP